ncbi:MAG: hypothetical protein AAFN92_06890, partial [Bacteroidota bacterium]
RQYRRAERVFGAAVTALSLSLLLPALRPWFSLSEQLLYPLAAIAGLFCLYSFSRYFYFPNNWRPYLRAIAVANLTYCAVTLFILVTRWDLLTGWDLAYFAGEIVLVVALALWEWRVALRKN